MRRLLSNPNIDGTVFEPLRDPAVFLKPKPWWGRFCGTNAADLAMLDKISRLGYSSD